MQVKIQKVEEGGLACNLYLSRKMPYVGRVTGLSSVLSSSLVGLKNEADPDLPVKVLLTFF